MNQNIYKEFEDHSWERMRALLDREMPESGLLMPPVSDKPLASKGSNRRIWLGVLGLLAIGILSSLSWYYFSKNEATEIRSVPLVETPVSKEKNALNTEGGYSPNSEITTNSMSVENKVSKKKNDLKAIDNQEIIPPISPLATVSNVTNFVIPRNEESAYKILNNSAYLEFLPLLQAYIMETPDTSLKINTVQTIVKTIPKNKSTHIFWGITMGTHTEGGKIIEGFQGGLVLNKKMGQKWMIQAGLNYRRNTAQGDSLTFVQLDAKAISGSATVTNFNLTQGRELTLKNLHYLELPVTVHYAFPKKLSAFMGLKAAYLLSNSVSIRDSSTFYVVNSATADKSSKYVTNNSVQSLGLKRWDGAIVGGVSYSVSPKMAVSLRYDFGFTNILTKHNWKAYNRYVGLNMTYNLATNSGVDKATN